VSAATTTATTPRKKLSVGAKRGIWIGVIALVILGVVLGTKVVSNDDPLVQGTQEFDPTTFGAENFPKVQEAIAERATDAATLAEAIAADPAAAAEEYAVASSGGPVYSVSFTGVVGEGQSGVYEVAVEGVPDDLLIRVQTGPAINGTELRDATGEITFGQFTNQIDYQDAASALNEELKAQVLAEVDTAALSGKTITVTGAFTLINPASWLVTPTEIEVS
jgi:predicted lipoprotein